MELYLDSHIRFHGCHKHKFTLTQYIVMVSGRLTPHNYQLALIRGPVCCRTSMPARISTTMTTTLCRETTGTTNTERDVRVKWQPWLSTVTAGSELPTTLVLEVGSQFCVSEVQRTFRESAVLPSGWVAFILTGFMILLSVLVRG